MGAGPGSLVLSKEKVRYFGKHQHTDQAFFSGLPNLQLDLFVGVNRHNSQRGAKLIELPLDGQPVLVFLVVIILHIRLMLKNAGHFRARHLGRERIVDFGRVFLNRVLSPCSAASRSVAS